MWAAEQDFEVLRTRFRIQSTDAAHGAELARLLAPFDYGRRTGVRGRNTFSIVDGKLGGRPDPDTLLVYRDCQLIASSRQIDLVYGTIVAELNRSAVEACDEFAVHAAVVSLDGVGVAFPADSGGGKSTLAAACLRQGFRYASDEALVVAGDGGAVIRYPKPLSLSMWSRQALGISNTEPGQHDPHAERFVTPSDLGSGLADDRIRLGHIVLAEFGHDDEADLEPAPGNEVMEALLRLSFNHYKDGARAFRLAAGLVNEAGIWRLRYGDPMAAAALVLNELGSDPD